MKINKFISMVKKKVRKLGVKRIDATEKDAYSMAELISGLNKEARAAEKTLVFDACGPAGTEILFFDEKLSKKRFKRR